MGIINQRHCTELQFSSCKMLSILLSIAGSVSSAHPRHCRHERLRPRAVLVLSEQIVTHGSHFRFFGTQMRSRTRRESWRKKGRRKIDGRGRSLERADVGGQDCEGKVLRCLFVLLEFPIVIFHSARMCVLPPKHTLYKTCMIPRATLATYMTVYFLSKTLGI